MGAFDAASAAPWQWAATRGWYDPAMRRPDAALRSWRSAGAASAGRSRRAPARRLGLSARYRTEHRPGHALCHGATISPAGRCPATARPNACCGARWRRRSPSVQADLAREQSQPESLRLLSPGPRGAPRLRAGLMTARAIAPPSGSSRRWRSARCSRSATSPRSRRIRPAARSISRWSSCRPRRRRRSIRRARYGPCTGPAAQRAPDNSLDMGTGFDCFDARSHTASGAIAAEQQRWRARLVAAMRRHGFQNYFREWWHFSYRAGRRAPYDFVIEGR